MQSTDKVDQIHLGSKFEPGVVILSKYTDFRRFGPDMKGQRSSESPGCSEPTIKVIRDMQSNNKVDQNHLGTKI